MQIHLLSSKSLGEFIGGLIGLLILSPFFLVRFLFAKIFAGKLGGKK